jgi:hypothetical protein
MKLSKELDDALEAVSKEVDSWPAWKRSLDLHDLKQQTESSKDCAASGERVTSNRKPRQLARAAGA